MSGLPVKVETTRNEEEEEKCSLEVMSMWESNRKDFN
jgi:hypothetical protein